MDALLRLDPDDPIAVALRPLRAGETVSAGDATVTLERDVAVGHKVALRAIAAGERVLKYRCPIGRATRAIAPGEYVHVHNLASEWIPSTLLPG